MIKDLTRRDFLRAGALAGGAAWVAPRLAFAAEEGYGGFRMGAQSYCFRKFDFKGATDRIKQLGLKHAEFCNVHFPPLKNDPGLPDVQAYLQEQGVKALSYGVENFSRDEEAARVKFDFGKALGVELLSANPARNAFDVLDKLTEEYDIKIAIHNHGPGADYDSVKDTLRAVEGRNPRIGACVDTGHVIRSGEKPHDVIRALGSRVLSLHLKDWVHKGEEQILGEGDLDLVEVARALREVNFSGPIFVEFELSPEDPSPGIAKGLENWKKAIAEA
jgi:inosose dehydratase